MKEIAILFDCDGVLINTAELEHNVVADMLAQENIHLSRQECLEQLYGATYGQFLDNVRAQFNQRAKQIPQGFVEELGRRVTQTIDAHATVIDGVFPLLRNLKQHNFPFATASNSGHAHLHFKLGKTGLRDRFDPHIHSCDDVSNPKPAPDIYLLAAERLGIAIENCIIIDDTATGVQAGAAAGAKQVIGFLEQHYRDASERQWLLDAGADIIADNMDDVWRQIAAQAGISLQIS